VITFAQDAIIYQRKQNNLKNKATISIKTQLQHETDKEIRVSPQNLRDVKVS